jgi:regulatory protein
MEEGGGDGRAGPLAGRVTSLEPQARDPERVNLYLDGRFAFGLSAAVAAEARLRVGVVLSAADVAALLRQEASEAALQQSLLLLSYRPRSEQEIRRALQQKGHAGETADAVVARLRDLHYLDDEAFAVTWVENRQRFRPRGGRLLRAELRQKGVDAETAEQAIADAGGDEHALALAAGEKRAAGLEGVDYAEFGRKVGGFLSRRGFTPDVVWEVVRELWTARGGETPA